LLPRGIERAVRPSRRRAGAEWIQLHLSEWLARSLSQLVMAGLDPAMTIFEKALSRALHFPRFRRLLLRPVEIDGGADQILQRLLIDLVALGEIDRAANIAFKAGVEQLRRILQRRAAGKRHLHDGLVGLAGADDAAVLPHGNAAPLPFLDHIGIGLLDQASDTRQRLAAP